ncbi:MAG: MarR family transcriptional regulator [Desulfobacterales bacterium]|nr:MarR family transcriptional regulator [Desulfobacterales bacterium]
MKNKKKSFPPKEDLEEVMEGIKAIPFLVIMNFADILKRYAEISFANPLHYNLLGFLIRHGGSLTPTELAKLLFRSKHSMTKVVDSLEKKGYVTRVPDSNDRRVLHIKITTAGLERVRKNTARGETLVKDIVSTLSDKEMNELVNYIRRLRQTIIKKLQSS